MTSLTKIFAYKVSERILVDKYNAQKSHVYLFGIHSNLLDLLISWVLHQKLEGDVYFSDLKETNS